MTFRMDAILLLLCSCHPIQIIFTIILALQKTFELITPHFRGRPAKCSVRSKKIYF